MGSWDVYCAICGACFGGAAVGKPKPKPKGKQWQTGTKTSTPDEGAGEDEGKEEEYDSDEEDYDSDEEEYTYDGDVIHEKDLEWLLKLRVLGFNPDAPGINKYVSTRSPASHIILV